MTKLAEAIRTERLALIDYLETLDPEEWATPSLCDRWTVQDVAAHLASAPALTVAGTLLEAVRAGFLPNKFTADSARRWSRRGPEAILAQLRENAANGATPPGVPEVAALVDAVVHALDIRRPLGSSRPVPRVAFAPAATFCAATTWPASIMVGGNVKARIRGLRLVADDVDWSWGEGAEVHGPSDALILMLSGRPIGPDELTGEGAAQLYERL